MECDTNKERSEMYFDLNKTSIEVFVLILSNGR
jgi:hypothetical protein